MKKYLIKYSNNLLHKNKKVFLHTNLFKISAFNFAKKHKKSKDNVEQKPEAVNELDYDQFEQNVNKLVSQFQKNIDMINLGKITPQTFESMYIQLQGENTSLLQLGQIIPINIQSVVFHPYDINLKDDILRVLNKDQLNDFLITEEGDSIKISKQNTDTADQRQKVFKMLKEKMHEKKKQVNEERRIQQKFLKDNKTRMSDELFKNGTQEVDRITQEGYKELERILKQKEMTLMH